MAERETRETFLIGEALIGKGNEVAHIDLMIGHKNGPVGQAFTNGLTQLSKGHTPLLAVIRPNIIPKPATLVIPKVTVQNMEDAGKIFGPAQAAVAKAVADAVEEGIIPKEYLEDYVVVTSVFIHPEAEDYEKIYRYNYSATKLSLKRAMTRYPDLNKINFEKDRATHPIAGVKMTRLWRPPYLQVAIDVTNLDAIRHVITELPHNDMIILEAGTPFIKEHGVKGIREIRKMRPDAFIIADLKTLDVGKVEVDMAYDETADAVVVAGLANKATIDSVIYEAHRLGIYAIVDMMNVSDPKKVLHTLSDLPDMVNLHRNIDEERAEGQSGQATDSRWQLIKEIKKDFPDKRVLFAVAGGVVPQTAKHALVNGADILVVGRYITQSKDVERATREFLNFLGEDTDLFRVHWE
ncbi:MAG: bifunctional 5,6,7,8-tetrahydromethanopterin hydro-lyase/3-hexulose-6-phosphate synthase [Candidatus Altiarchaeota archaeon]|nr:bifunctional 5,6,7,8-tetrahydromethanopterin hydro-lyase/3-hexulose-6-phosphate synthase [Candidatus Altiarchaeota archaeon]